MANLKMLRRIQSNYGQQVADLWGVAYSAPNLRVVRGLQADTGAISQGGPNGITIDAKVLRGLSRNDLRSIYVHEATHALGVGQDTYSNPGGHRRFENLADASTYLLAPYDNPGWKPRDAVLKLVERQGLSPVAAAPNRPSHGGNPGARRNTGNSQRSGNNGNIPTAPQPPATAVLPPGQSQAYTAQLMALQSQYSQRLAASKLTAGSIKSQRVATFADIRAQQIQGAVGAEADALSRGIVGSSADLGARAGVVAGAATARVDARTAAGTALAQNRITTMQAGTDYSMGVAGVMADKAAAQAELANQRYMNGLIGQATSTYEDLFKKYLARILDRGKNPPGVDPRAGANPDLVRPYGGQYSGKVEPQGQYYPNPVAGTPWATGGGL